MKNQPFFLLPDGLKIFQLFIKTVQLLPLCTVYFLFYWQTQADIFYGLFYASVSFEGLISNTCVSNIPWPELMVRTKRLRGSSQPNLIWKLSCLTLYSHPPYLLLSRWHSNENVAPLHCRSASGFQVLQVLPGQALHQRLLPTSSRFFAKEMWEFVVNWRNGEKKNMQQKEKKKLDESSLHPCLRRGTCLCVFASSPSCSLSGSSRPLSAKP